VSASALPDPKALIFDLGGTLVDTVGANRGLAAHLRGGRRAS
jgi:hypothetical protein